MRFFTSRRFSSKCTQRRSDGRMQTAVNCCCAPFLATGSWGCSLVCFLARRKWRELSFVHRGCLFGPYFTSARTTRSFQDKNPKTEPAPHPITQLHHITHPPSPSTFPLPLNGCRQPATPTCSANFPARPPRLPPTPQVPSTMSPARIFHSCHVSFENQTIFTMASHTIATHLFLFFFSSPLLPVAHNPPPLHRQTEHHCIASSCSSRFQWLCRRLFISILTCPPRRD